MLIARIVGILLVILAVPLAASAQTSVTVMTSASLDADAKAEKMTPQQYVQKYLDIQAKAHDRQQERAKLQQLQKAIDGGNPQARQALDQAVKNLPPTPATKK